MQRPTLARTLVPALIIVTAVVAGLAVIRGFVATQHPTNGNSHIELRVGGTVGDLDLVRFEDDKVVKLSQLGSKIFLLNFWASWCEACLVEMPSLVKLRDAYHARGFEVIPVNVDENPKAIVPKMRDLLHIHFPVYVDRGQSLAQLFNVHGIPFTVILTRQGNILHIETGERDWFAEEIRAEVERWLKSGS